MSSKKSLIIASVTITIAIALIIFVIGGLSSRLKRANTSASSQPHSEATTPLSDTDAEVISALPLFHRLNENYARGSQPARGGVAALARLGVKTVIDLRSIYDHTDEIGVAVERKGLRYYWLPLSVWDPATDAEAREFVSLVMDESKGPFFVFCSDGLHRTGEMSAIYRVAHDHWGVEQAVKEMDELGFNPYYYSLRNYVWTYARKFHPTAVPAKARRLSPIEQLGVEEAESKKR